MLEVVYISSRSAHTGQRMIQPKRLSKKARRQLTKSNPKSCWGAISGQWEKEMVWMPGIAANTFKPSTQEAELCEFDIASFRTARVLQ